MNQPVVVISATVALIVLTAFFVVIEFALLGARQHRLETDAKTSRSARAALRGVNELTLMLAVAQLGITACTFALGAITKPAVDAALGTALASWGLAVQVADVSAFVLSLLVVTFLHLVIGEMMPKSWAIAHPEFAAKIIGVPSRALAWIFRPLLVWMNRIANRLVVASGVEPAERHAAGGQDVATIRQLVEHSGRVGTLNASFRSQLSRVLDIERLKVEDMVREDSVDATTVPATATAGDVRRVAADTGHLRVLLRRGAGVPGVVHVRDLLLEPEAVPAAEHVREPLILSADAPVYEALSTLREAGEQLAVVVRGDRVVGVLTVADILRRIMPRGSSLNL
ncbi:membrane protein [Leucobacter sp. Psy1]|uniref:CNNM domain-containing protein n=1 Tax=Leucobacter sp. Psy1 TaxID=2875729 RepID=UPI001CD35E75|nr:CNNM domain-containing protein [Leucobacter sp. Psy1]UBH05546.1 membrane protein [Leucobacter sp. Psy1]